MNTLTIVYLSAACTGLWLACRLTGWFPTARMWFAAGAGAGISELAGGYIEDAFGWVQKQANQHLPGHWPLLLPALIVAALFVSLGLLAIGSAPRERPHRTAEIAAFALATLLLFAGGAWSQLLAALHHGGA